MRAKTSREGLTASSLGLTWLFPCERLDAALGDGVGRELGSDSPSQLPGAGSGAGLAPHQLLPYWDGLGGVHGLVREHPSFGLC